MVIYHLLSPEFTNPQPTLRVPDITAAVGLFRGGAKIALAKFCILKSHFTVTCAPYKEIHVIWQNSNNVPNYFDHPCK